MWRLVALIAPEAIQFRTVSGELGPPHEPVADGRNSTEKSSPGHNTHDHSDLDMGEQITFWHVIPEGMEVTMDNAHDEANQSSVEHEAPRLPGFYRSRPVAHTGNAYV
jgi:hypothetical protein